MVICFRCDRELEYEPLVCKKCHHGFCTACSGANHTCKKCMMSSQSQCKSCGCRMTWADSKRQFGRLMKLGFQPEQIKELLPRHQSCMTQKMKTDQIGPYAKTK